MRRLLWTSQKAGLSRECKQTVDVSVLLGTLPSYESLRYCGRYGALGGDAQGPGMDRPVCVIPFKDTSWSLKKSTVMKGIGDKRNVGHKNEIHNSVAFLLFYPLFKPFMCTIAKQGKRNIRYSFPGRRAHIMLSLN